MKCPKCNYEVEKTWKNCANCGCSRPPSGWPDEGKSPFEKSPADQEGRGKIIDSVIRAEKLIMGNVGMTVEQIEGLLAKLTDMIRGGSPSDAEFHYDSLVVKALEEGGDLEEPRVRNFLEKQRRRLRLPLRTCREIEAACLERRGFAAAPVQPAIRPGGGPRTSQAGSVCEWTDLKMVLVPEGDFTMGMKEYDYNPRRSEYVEAFYVGVAPVTRRQFEVFLRESDYDYPSDDLRKMKELSPTSNCPACNLSWDDAQEFCRWLSQKTGQDYRLPTEAEWEKAARGTDGRTFPWGSDSPTNQHANFDGETNRTTEIGRHLAGKSPYGCMDMAGNVWEWCEDWLNDKHEYRIKKGGAWVSKASYLKCAYRQPEAPDRRSQYNGFRVARTP
jgi:sulfatase modifying factor 1